MTRRLTILLSAAACILLPPAHSDARASTPASRVERGDTRSDSHKRIAAVRHGHASPVQTAIRLAVTVDDLPGGGPEVLGYTHVQMVKDIIAALQAHHVPHAAGFIVGEMLQTNPERSEAIDAWVQAGFVVGNHTYSHEKLATLGLQRFMDDIVKNRTMVDPFEKRSAQQQSYFRFPYLEEGASQAERNALWQLLQSQRYTLVRASVTFSDTDWADAYLRCTLKGEKDSLDALDQSYLANALAHLRWSIAAAQEVLGHPIPLVLLLHVNMPTAKNLDALLRVYEAQGVQFAPIEEAMREPAYAARYDAPGGDLLSQASAYLGRPRPPELVEPDVLIDRICR